MSTDEEAPETAPADDTPPRSPPNLSRVQVYLYAVLALFVGVLLTGAARALTDQLGRDRTLFILAALGVLVGGALALGTIYAVVRRMRGLPAERRYRFSRLHTIALTGVLLAFLAVATVQPSILVPASPSGGLEPPTNLFAALPLAAAVTVLVVLGLAARRLNRPRRD